MATLRDPERQKGYWQKYYEKNKEDVKRRATIHRNANKVAAREVIKQAKDVPCMDCEVRYPTCVMDFDHVRDVKLFNISSSIRSAIALKRLIEEIAKCEVVCANCHRIRTHNRRLAGVAHVG